LLRASISRSLGCFPYENRVPEGKSSEIARLTSASKTASKALCYRYTTGYQDLQFRFANFASGAISKVYSGNG
jgi:hypothetical protein